LRFLPGARNTAALPCSFHRAHVEGGIFMLARSCPRDDLPSLGALRVVDAACRHGNYRAAGRELSISHSAISQQVARLEQQLAVKLFVRDGVTMKPTPAGEELADGYRRALRTLERSLQRATTRESEPKLVVSLPASVANPWLRHRLDVFGHALAAARVEVRSENVEPDFTRVDVAVVAGEAPHEGLWVEHLFDRSVTPVCSPGFQQAHGLNEPEHLERTPLLVHDEEAWRTWFAAAGLKPAKLSGPVLDATMAIGAAMDGYGVAMACRISASTELEQGRLVQPFELWAATSTRFHLVWPEDHPQLDRIHAFADWMKREIGLSLADPQPMAPAA
jgi:LysR family glycine cleavage system transcriptional activator